MAEAASGVTRYPRGVGRVGRNDTWLFAPVGIVVVIGGGVIAVLSGADAWGLALTAVFTVGGVAATTLLTWVSLRYLASVVVVLVALVFGVAAGALPAVPWLSSSSRRSQV